MKKGFTLVELLIVVVIVGTMVALALPKYQNALERGRALEGLRNVQYIAEYMAAKHMATGDWPTPTSDDLGRLKQTDIVKKRFFGDPVITANIGTTGREITITRNGDWAYSLKATVTNDVLAKIVCIGDDCSSLDLGSGAGTDADNLMNRK